MKKINFLIKLYIENKIQEVEPSEEIKNAYMERSRESLSSAKILFDVNNLKDSVALAYYSMYHCLTALLFKIGIKCENHVGSIILLKKVFKIDNKQILKSKADRVDKQYYVDFNINKEEAEKSIKIAENFIAEINEFTARMNLEDTKNYHKTTINLFSKNEKSNN